MKRLLVLLMAVMLTVLMGCATMQVKADDPGSIQVLLKRADRCESNEDGWRILSIPQTEAAVATSEKEEKLRVALVVYKKGDTVGYGMVNERGISVIMQYDPEQKTWIFIFMGSYQLVTDEQQAEFWTDWVKVLDEDFSLNGAYCGIPVFPPIGTKI